MRDLATSVPGRSAALLRSVFYDLMNLPEPPAGPVLAPYPPTDLAPLRGEVEAWWARVDLAPDGVHALRRWPADVPPAEGLDRYLVVAAGHPRHDLYGLAAVIVLPHDGPPAAEVFAARPACRLVVRHGTRDRCEATSRDGATVTVRVTDPGPVDASVYASAMVDLTGRVELSVGDHRTTVER